jgi:hypothetical protein
MNAEADGVSYFFDNKANSVLCGIKKWLTEGGFAAVDSEASAARSAGRKVDCGFEANVAIRQWD